MANKIGWCDKTINPVVGCNIGCDYCYARRESKRVALMQAGAYLTRKEIPYKHLPENKRLERFKQSLVWCQGCYDYNPHEHLERLEQLTPRQKPMKVFIDSMWDWNSPGVMPEWCRQIIAKMTECSQHIFLILSKNPEGYVNYVFPRNVWLGTTVTGKSDVDRINMLIGATHSNIVWGSNFHFASFEPLLDEIPITLYFQSLDWIIIGALSREGKEPKQPEKKWVKHLLIQADRHETPVYMKDNLIWPDMRKEFPKAMEHTIRKVA